MNIEELKQDENLKAEFLDLLFSDKDFNYNVDEFEEWIVDLVLPNVEQQ